MVNEPSKYLTFLIKLEEDSQLNLQHWINGKDFKCDNFRFYYQIEPGNKQTSFIPHKEQIVNLSIPQTMYKEDKYAYITKEEAKELGLDESGIYRCDIWDSYTITGNEAWAYYPSGKYFYNQTILTSYPRCADKAVPIPFFSNMYVDKNVTNTNAGDNIMAVKQQSDRNAEVDISMYELNGDVNLFKAKLKELYESGNPIYFVYKLLEPKYTKVEDGNLINLFKSIAEYDDEIIIETDKDVVIEVEAEIDKIRKLEVVNNE